MSRTIRRKNAWNEHYFVEELLNDKWFQEHRRNTKYKGCSEEQVLAKLKASYHGETPPNWTGGRPAKEFSRWYLRNKNKMELIQALKTGQEDNLLLSTKKGVDGIWWYYD